VTTNVTTNERIRTKKPLQSNDYRGFRVCLVPVAGLEIRKRLDDNYVGVTLVN